MVTKLKSLRQQQDDDIIEFHNKWDLYAPHAGYNEDALLDIYRQAILPELREKIVSTFLILSTLDEWRQRATVMDRARREDAARRQLESRLGSMQYHQPPQQHQQPRVSPIFRKAASVFHIPQQQQPQRTQWRPMPQQYQEAQEMFSLLQSAPESAFEPQGDEFVQELRQMDATGLHYDVPEVMDYGEPIEVENFDDVEAEQDAQRADF
ncbi:hypothetical protein AX16_008699 [Volvariella volvacea WC 439]|nr:hypothetical protein AX16_008699 [Volvariella volvacea WC 439]